MNNPEFRQELQASDPTAVVLGSQVFVNGITSGGKLYVFSRSQMQFLLGLQKLKNVDAAAISVGQTSEWAQKFLSSRKFKTYIHGKMQEVAVRNGLTVEWWYQFGQWLTEAKRTWFEGACEFCVGLMVLYPYEAETFRQDDMTLKASCLTCFKPVYLIEKSEPFTPTREQVEGWKELGSRLLPKVERVSHTFEKSEFVFESQGEPTA